MIPGVAASQDFLKVFLESEFGAESDPWKFFLRKDFESLAYSFRTGSEFLARWDMENKITVVFSGFNFVLHLAHHFTNFRRSLRKSFAANCTFLLAVHRAMSSANWDF